jgi:hypothetical protein
MDFSKANGFGVAEKLEYSRPDGLVKIVADETENYLLHLAY